MKFSCGMYQLSSVERVSYAWMGWLKRPKLSRVAVPQKKNNTHVDHIPPSKRARDPNRTSRCKLKLCALHIIVLINLSVCVCNTNVWGRNDYDLNVKHLQQCAVVFV